MNTNMTSQQKIPKRSNPKRKMRTQPQCGVSRGVQSNGKKLISHQCEESINVQPKKAQTEEPKHVKRRQVKRSVLQPLTEKATGVQPKEGSVKSQSPEPKIVPPLQGIVIPHQGKTPRRLQHPKEESTPIEFLKEKPQQPVSAVPMSLRMQIKMAIKNSQIENAPVQETLAEERLCKRKTTKGTGRTYLHSAALKGNHVKVKTYLEQGRNPDLPNNAGFTALHDASLYGRTKVVNVLVNAGANVNALDKNGDTPIFDAVTAGKLKIVKLLINHGANPWHKNKRGLEASYFANSTVKKYLQDLKYSFSRQ